MLTNQTEISRSIMLLLNGTNKALKNVVPVDYKLSKPALQNNSLYVNYGVFIGLLGDIKGKLVFIGDEKIFRSLGEVMFGFPVEGEMLNSFSGELGNMIAGNLSTEIVNEGISIDITAPSIIKGDAHITGHNVGIQVVSSFDNIGDLHINLLIDR